MQSCKVCVKPAMPTFLNLNSDEETWNVAILDHPHGTNPLPSSSEPIPMCRKITCATCSKATWAGCGQHIDAALSGVPLADRCALYKTKSGCAGSAPSTAAPAAETKAPAACKD